MNDTNNLKDIHLAHKGKGSDKWSIYFDIYEEELTKYRFKPISMLEIGIQNGGSLEIWEKYFPNATRIIGCDINKKCEELTYSSAKINVVVNDANSAIGFERITKLSSELDVIIDDGSHNSSDIIKSFNLYFPLLKEGGIYIVEDLCCSYWNEFEGGLYNKTSSISFFKKLCDIIYFEHWDLKETKTEFLATFAKHYNFKLNESELAKIHSVSFYNSVCIIKKKAPKDNVLGKRIITGKDFSVIDQVKGLQGSFASDLHKPLKGLRKLKSKLAKYLP